MSPVALVVLWAQSAVAHQGHTSTLAWDACTTHTLGEVCEFETDHQEIHIGTCRSMSGELLCVRNRPIVRAEPRPAPSSTSSSMVLGSLGALCLLGALISPALVGRPRT